MCRWKKDEFYSIMYQMNYYLKKNYLIMWCFCIFRSKKKKLLLGCSPLYQYKLEKPEVQYFVNRNKTKLEPFGDLVDQTFAQFNEN